MIKEVQKNPRVWEKHLKGVKISKNYHAQTLTRDFLECAEEFRQYAPEEVRRNQKEYEAHNNSLRVLANNIQKTKGLLDSFYSLDVVPAQYRNMYAMHYLREFMMSSKESLSNALFHMDLKDIMNKLDAVIERQSTEIAQQAYIISQNTQILRDNSAMLRHLEEINTNTEMGAKYSRLAAENANACAFFSTLNYLTR